MRPDWREAVPPEDSDILRDYETYIPEIAEEVGIDEVLDWFEASSMLPIRIGVRQKMDVTDANLALENLYRTHVLLPSLDLVDSKTETENAHTGSPGFAAQGLFNFSRLYNVFVVIAVPIVMVALLLLQRHLLLRRHSQPNTSSSSRITNAPNSPTISDLPLTSHPFGRSYLSDPFLLRQSAIRTRRQKEPVWRQFEGDVTTDVPTPINSPTILPVPPALDITADAPPQPPLPVPLPSVAAYPVKQNRFRQFFSALFHRQRRADGGHNQKSNKQESKRHLARRPGRSKAEK
jgi:hypothetical protein